MSPESYFVRCHLLQYVPVCPPPRPLLDVIKCLVCFRRRRSTSTVSSNSVVDGQHAILLHNDATVTQTAANTVNSCDRAVRSALACSTIPQCHGVQYVTTGRPIIAAFRLVRSRHYKQPPTSNKFLKAQHYYYQYQLKFYIARIRNFVLFGRCHLDLDPMTIIYEFEPYPMKISPQTENELSTSTPSKVAALQTQRRD